MKSAWRVTLLGSLCYFSFTFTWNVLAAQLPVVTDTLGWSSFESGAVLGAVAFVIFVSWPVLGPVVDRVGPVRSLLAGTVLVALAGGSRAVLGSSAWFFVAMAAVGVGGSSATYGVPALVGSWFDSNRVGAPLGVVTVAALLGTVASFAVVPVLVTTGLHWRAVFLVTALVPAVVAVGWFAAGAVGPRYEPGETRSFGAVGGRLRQPAVVVLILVAVTYLFATHSLYGWLATLLAERGVALGVAGTIVAVVTTGQIFGAVALPVVSDRVNARLPVLAGSGVVYGVAMGAMAQLGGGFVGLVGVGFLAGVGLGGVSPLLRVFPVEWFEPNRVASVVAAVFGIGAFGGFVGPILVGTVRSDLGAETAVGVLAVPGAVFVVLAGVLWFVASMEPAKRL